MKAQRLCLCMHVNIMNFYAAFLDLVMKDAQYVQVHHIHVQTVSWYHVLSCHQTSRPQ